MYNSEKPLSEHEAIENDILIIWAAATGRKVVGRHTQGRTAQDAEIEGPIQYVELREKNCTLASCDKVAQRLPYPFVPLSRRPYRSGVVMTQFEFLKHVAPFYFVIKFTDGIYEAAIDPTKVDAATSDGFMADGSPDIIVAFPTTWFKKVV